MSRMHVRKLGLAAAGIAAMMATGAGAATVSSSEDCPTAANSGAAGISSLTPSRTTDNAAAKKKMAARKKTARARAGTVLEDIEVEKEVDKAGTTDRPARMTGGEQFAKAAKKRTRGKAAQKAARRRRAQRDPC